MTGKSGENRAVQSLAATVDVECQGDFNLLPKAVNDSLATIARMQQAVARIFRGRFQFGEFDPVRVDSQFTVLLLQSESIFRNSLSRLYILGTVLTVVGNAAARTHTHTHTRGFKV